MNAKEQENLESRHFPQLIQELKSTFDEYLSGFEEREELYSFMADEKNMYQENGQPTDAYREWMEKVNNYMRLHQIKDVVSQNPDASDSRKEALEGMGNYQQLKEKLMRSITQAKSISGFDIIDWLRNVLAQEDNTKDEISQNIEDFKELTDKILRKDGQDND